MSRRDTAPALPPNFTHTVLPLNSIAAAGVTSTAALCSHMMARLTIWQFATIWSRRSETWTVRRVLLLLLLLLRAAANKTKFSNNIRLNLDF